MDCMLSSLQQLYYFLCVVCKVSMEMNGHGNVSIKFYLQN